MSKRLLSVAGLLAVACTGCATGLTGSPETISDEGAVLQGHVISNSGGPVEYWVEYGPTSAYGSATPHASVGTVQNQPAPVEVQLSGLQRSTIYHYRLCARDSQQQGGPGCGEDQRFRTQSFGCGEAVTTDIRLTGSMECAENVPVLVVGAPGIDINLAGHTLRERSPNDDEYDTTPPVLLNAGGHDDVTVRNGTLSGLAGIDFTDAARTRILRVNIVTHVFSYAVHVSGAGASEARHLTTAGNVSFSEADGAVIADSTMQGNGAAYIIGNDSRIVRNVGGPGLNFTSGIGVFGDRNRIAENRVFGYMNGNIDVIGGTDNVVVDNEVFRPELYSGWRGIRVRDAAVNTLVRDNVAYDHSEDGILVESPTTRLGGNTANDNQDLGIDAVPGVIDLGGNTASGNGNPLQCRNVFCQ